MHKAFDIKETPTHMPARPADVKEAYCDSTLAKEVAGYEEKADLVCATRELP